MISTETIRWQCSGCDHLCAVLLDKTIKPDEITQCWIGDTAWRKVDKAQLAKADKAHPDREQIEKIVAHQFDLVTNLTQEAYIDSLKMIGDQVLALIDPEGRQVAEDIFREIEEHPDFKEYGWTIEDALNEIKQKHLGNPSNQNMEVRNDRGKDD